MRHSRDQTYLYITSLMEYVNLTRVTETLPKTEIFVNYLTSHLACNIKIRLGALLRTRESIAGLRK